MSRDGFRRTASLSLALAFALGCKSLPAAALDMELVPYQGKRILVLAGRLERQDGDRFEKLLPKVMPVDEVWISSPGGSTMAGYAIGRAIRRAGLSVRLPAKAVCASACADLFMGGVARRVDEGAQFGIHMGTVAGPENLAAMVEVFIDELSQISQDDLRRGNFDLKRVRRKIQEFEQLAAREAAEWATYIIEMGGSLRLVALGTKTEAGNMNYLNRRELLDLNVVNVGN